MTTVACVLRSGGDFSPRWVHALRRGLNRHAPEHRFVCLTDVGGLPPMWVRLLKHLWPGWWSKMELFRPGLFKEGERVVYLDLDTLVVGDPSDLFAYDGPLGMMTGFYKNIPQSGVMAWTPNEITASIWEAFMRDPKAAMASARGDGEWIGRFLAQQGIKPDRLMREFPGQIVSLKLHAKSDIPDGARLVLGHGQPRLNDPAAGWAYEEWNKMVPRRKAA